MTRDREPEPEFLSVADVAARLQLSDETVRRWASEGRLAAVRSGASGGSIRMRSIVSSRARSALTLPRAASGTPASRC